MSYEKLQYVAYVLNTFPPLAPKELKKRYYPGLADPRQDIDARIALLERALDTAATARNLGGADTLKIFMMPEFAFRGITGAYDMGGLGDKKQADYQDRYEVGSVQYAIARLKALVDDKRWADWIFMFGTVLGGSQSADAKTDIYNFSLVQRGGDNPPQSDSHIVMKELFSTSDFIARADIAAAPELVPAGVLLKETVRYMDAGAAGAGRENQLQNFDGGGIFDGGGVRLGTEICLDHLRQRVSKSPQLPGDVQVQVQLVPSCGASLDTTALLIDASGYVFCCDGKFWGSTASQPLLRDAAPLAFQELPVAADVLTLPFGNVAISSLYGQGVDRMFNSGQGVRPPGAGSEAGQIVVYDPVPMPPQHLVPGSKVELQWRDRGYQIDVNLIYDSAANYIGASGAISNARADVNGLAQMLPMTLSGTDSNDEPGYVTLQVRRGGDGYPLGIDCTATLPDLAQSGLIAEFYRKYDPKTPPKR